MTTLPIPTSRPNALPCVRCNERVKFRDLLDLALDLGAEWLATGHHARRMEGDAGPELHRAADAGRDQSYFLFATSREQLRRLRLPIGEFSSKRDVRAYAARIGLPVAEKPDSQDICFVQTGGYAKIVAQIRPQAGQPGPILHEDGTVLGSHAESNISRSVSGAAWASARPGPCTSFESTPPGTLSWWGPAVHSARQLLHCPRSIGSGPAPWRNHWPGNCPCWPGSVPLLHRSRPG